MVVLPLVPVTPRQRSACDGSSVRARGHWADDPPHVGTRASLTPEAERAARRAARPRRPRPLPARASCPSVTAPGMHAKQEPGPHASAVVLERTDVDVGSPARSSAMIPSRRSRSSTCAGPSITGEPRRYRPGFRLRRSGDPLDGQSVLHDPREHRGGNLAPEELLRRLVDHDDGGQAGRSLPARTRRTTRRSGTAGCSYGGFRAVPVLPATV